MYITMIGVEHIQFIQFGRKKAVRWQDQTIDKARKTAEIDVRV